MTRDKRQTETSGKKTERQVMKPMTETKQENTESSGAIEAGKPFEEFLGRAQKAYTAYQDAQKEVWMAYRETELRVEDEYIKAEQNANMARNEAMKQALGLREKTEQEAEEARMKAKEQAKRTYEQNIQQTLSACEQAIGQAWETRKQALEQAWKIFVK